MEELYEAICVLACAQTPEQKTKAAKDVRGAFDAVRSRIAELEKDAARLKFICEYLPSDRVDLDDDFVACESAGDVVALIDTAMKKD